MFRRIIFVAIDARFGTLAIIRQFLHACDLCKGVAIGDEEKAEEHRDTRDYAEGDVNEGIAAPRGIVIVEVVGGGPFRLAIARLGEDSA